MPSPKQSVLNNANRIHKQSKHTQTRKMVYTLEIHFVGVAWFLPSSCFRRCEGTICAAKVKHTLSEPGVARWRPISTVWQLQSSSPSAQMFNP